MSWFRSKEDIKTIQVLRDCKQLLENKLREERNKNKELKTDIESFLKSFKFPQDKENSK